MPYLVKLYPLESEFISPEFKTKTEAEKYMNSMMRQYENQGFYSSAFSGPIPFAELKAEVVHELEVSED